jgi:hypothetical protein
MGIFLPCPSGFLIRSEILTALKRAKVMETIAGRIAVSDRRPIGFYGLWFLKICCTGCILLRMKAVFPSSP